MQKINGTLAVLVMVLLVQATPSPVRAQATEEAIDTQEVMMEATGLFQEGDWEGGLEVLEKAIEKAPQDYRLMMGASEAYTSYGVQLASDDRKAANEPLRRGAALMRKVRDGKDKLSESEQQQLATCIYNEACCAAVDGNADETFKLLEEAAAAGFDDVGLLRRDSDFERVKDDERFAQFADKLAAEKDDDDGEDDEDDDEDDDDEDDDEDDDDHDHDDDDHDHDDDDA